MSRDINHIWLTLINSMILSTKKLYEEFNHKFEHI